MRYTICMKDKYTHARTCVYNINYHIICIKQNKEVPSMPHKIIIAEKNQQEKHFPVTDFGGYI